MREDTSLRASDAANAFGTQRRRLPRVSIAIALGVVFVRLLLLALTSSSVRALLHIGSRLPSCGAAGISTSEAHEGMCARTSGLFGTATVYNVIDRSHMLQMPEYQARLLTSRVTSTRVSASAVNTAYYPDGRGLLVSFEVVIINTSGKSLLFGPGVGYQLLPSYPKDATVELLLPTSSGSNNDVGFPALLNGKGAPSPSVFQQRPIPANGVLTGWVTFVAPPWSRGLLSTRPADLDFFRIDHDDHYVGQIRLWK